MSLPAELHYTDNHEWIHLRDDIATVGITPYAAQALGDIVYVELPDIGTAVSAGTVCGEIESTKSVSDLFAPVTGEVTERNDEAIASPELVNSDPFGDGWLVRVRVADLPDLLDAAAYAALTGDTDK